MAMIIQKKALEAMFNDGGISHVWFVYEGQGDGSGWVLYVRPVCGGKAVLHTAHSGVRSWKSLDKAVEFIVGMWRTELDKSPIVSIHVEIEYEKEPRSPI